MSTRPALLLIFMASLLPVAASATETPLPQLSGQAAALDGNTLIFRPDGKQVRLFGLSTPALSGSGALLPAGLAARQHLHGLVQDKQVSCSIIAAEALPRGICLIDGKQDLAIAMIEAGHGIVDRLQIYQPAFGENSMAAYDAAEAKAAENRREAEPGHFKRWETLYGNIIGAVLAGIAAGIAALLTIRATRKAAQDQINSERENAKAQILAERHNRALDEINVVRDILRHHDEVFSNLVGNLVDAKDQLAGHYDPIFAEVLPLVQNSIQVLQKAYSDALMFGTDYLPNNAHRDAVIKIKEVDEFQLPAIRALPKSVSPDRFVNSPAQSKVAPTFIQELEKAWNASASAMRYNQDDISWAEYDDAVRTLSSTLEQCRKHLRNVKEAAVPFDAAAKPYEDWFAEHGELTRNKVQPPIPEVS